MLFIYDKISKMSFFDIFGHFCVWTFVTFWVFLVITSGLPGLNVFSANDTFKCPLHKNAGVSFFMFWLLTDSNSEG
jgi:hypothetical protein